MLFRKSESKEMVETLIKYQGYEIPESNENIDICLRWFFDTLKWRQYSLDHGVPKRIDFDEITNLRHVYEVDIESDMYFYEIINSIDEAYISFVYEQKKQSK